MCWSTSCGEVVEGPHAVPKSKEARLPAHDMPSASYGAVAEGWDSERPSMVEIAASPRPSTAWRRRAPAVVALLIGCVVALVVSHDRPSSISFASSDALPAVVEAAASAAGAAGAAAAPVVASALSTISAIVNVTTPGSSARMKLYVDAAVTLTAPITDDLTCAVKYWPADGSDGTDSTQALYSATTAFSPDGTRAATFQLFRLIPSTEVSPLSLRCAPKSAQ